MTILEKMYENSLFNPATTDDMGEDFHNAMNRIVNAENELLNKFPDCKDILEEYQSAESNLNYISQRYDFARALRQAHSLFWKYSSRFVKQNR